SLIENYLGFPKGVSGEDLARRARAQATRFGAEVLVPASVTGVTRNDPFKIVHLADGSDVTTKAIIVASGVEYRRLSADGLDDLTGMGVYYGTSQIEGAKHRNEPIFVVGGGNSAGQAALFLSQFTDSVTIVIRSDDLSATMSQYLIDNIDANDSVDVLPHSQVVSVEGDGHLQHLTLSDRKTSEERRVEVGALFIFIGQAAHTDWLANMVELDDSGFVLTGPDLGTIKGWTADREPLPLETSIPGIFASGDVRHGSIRRVAGAVGEGATAVRFVHVHLASL
ncbi:MAG: NAD(P)/FAD-dependent oxidoreductase, partial [Acidimicrobiia bacterium]